MTKFLFILLFPISLFSQSNFEKGEKLFEAKKYELAKPYFETHLKTYPSDLKTLECLGDIHGASKQWDEAIVYYEKLKNLNSKNADYWYKYGGAMGMKAKSANKFTALGMLDDIEDAFLLAAKLDTKHVDVRWALIVLYLELPGILGGSEKKSQKYADELLSLSLIDGYLAKGYIDEYFKRYTAAEKQYIKGINLTHSVTAYKKLVDLYTKMKLTQKAIATQEESNKYNK
jgi:tetratricopeptide (TPR) repeat protein